MCRCALLRLEDPVGPLGSRAGGGPHLPENIHTPQTLPDVKLGNGQSSSRFPLPKRVHPNVKMPIIGGTVTPKTTVFLTTLNTIYTLPAANIANLTTVFTPPASCATPCYFLDNNSRSDVALIGPACSYSGNDHRGCEPGSYNTSAIVLPYYSPGICPKGFTTACSPIPGIGFSLNVTAQVCCPTYEVPSILSLNCPFTESLIANL
jgi:hypothetical protein